MRYYYKYQSFGPHTGLNFVMLFKHSAHYFPRKSFLNDPTDCEPFLEIPNNKSAIREALTKIRNSERSLYFGLEAANLLSQLDSDDSDEETSKGTGLLYQNPFLQTTASPLSNGQNLIRRFMGAQIGIPRIFSLSRSWNIPQMWSHYAGAHSGFCIEYQHDPDTASDPKCLAIRYTRERSRVSLDLVLLLDTQTDIAEGILERVYCEKSEGWRSEEEIRFVARKVWKNDDICVLSLPSGDFYKMSNLMPKRIIFGAQCDQNKIDEVAKIAAEHLEVDSRPEFVKLVQKKDSYEFDELAIKFDEFGNRKIPKIPPLPPLPPLKSH
ncbi:MAG: DUF2971 domain-containing protein [Hyphomicrobiaceae bacterium]|nr:DUF2971 domain-containing protein [Hyphomicrobiaceae bacterium]MCC0023561.1 DUF2971 domain-containing protein [Hyphomicrobiaceae bacterium]